MIKVFPICDHLFSFYHLTTFASHQFTLSVEKQKSRLGLMPRRQRIRRPRNDVVWWVKPRQFVVVCQGNVNVRCPASWLRGQVPFHGVAGPVWLHLLGKSFTITPALHSSMWVLQGSHLIGDHLGSGPKIRTNSVCLASNQDLVRSSFASRAR